MNKKSYFQGTEEPTPKKKKYKSDKAMVVQPRFKMPFFRNYDLYDTEGKVSPGAGLHSGKYKSVEEFLDAKRKKMKDFYKADDSWIEDDGKISKNYNGGGSNIKIRAAILYGIFKSAIDFPIDDQISDPIGYSNSNLSGGQTDQYLPLNDFEGKSPDKLNFGRDYENDDPGIPQDILDKFFDKYLLNPKEPALFGLPDGIIPSEDLDADKTISNKNPYYGLTDSGNIVNKF